MHKLQKKAHVKKEKKQETKQKQKRMLKTTKTNKKEQIKKNIYIYNSFVLIKKAF